MKKKKKIQSVNELRSILNKLLSEADDNNAEKSDKKPVLPKGKKSAEENMSVDNKIDETLDEYERRRTDDHDDFDPEGYAIDVFNFLENYENIINMKDIVLKRASKRLTEHKGQDAKGQFLDAMQQNHGVSIGKAHGENDDEIVPPVGQFGGPDVGGGIASGGGSAPGGVA